MTNPAHEKTFLHVMVPDPIIYRALAPYIGHAPFEKLYIINENEQNPAPLVLDDIPCPLRLGRLLDFLIAWQMRYNVVLPDYINVSGGQILRQGQEIIRKNGDIVPLTARETEIIRALYTAPLRTMARAELLSSIWGYVPDIETHTLETHIYRVRQKLEQDPSAPQTVITTEKGYQFCLA